MQIFKIYHGHIYIYIYAENIFEEALIEDICIQIFLKSILAIRFLDFRLMTCQRLI